MIKFRFWATFSLALGMSSLPGAAHSQFLMDMVDTTKELGRGMLSTYKRFDHIRISGYMQPQYQVASAEGAKNYSGGDFQPNSNNRFMLRRGRVRFDYAHFSHANDPQVQFAFQFDGTERGVFIRDFWGRFWENKWRLFMVTTGMFARPFGYEINLSSGDREAPERGRASQILMKTERDLGVMLSLEPRKRTNWLKYLELDAGFFNGQGLTSPQDFDSYKDFIGQLLIRPLPIGGKMQLGGGISLLQGGFRQFASYAFRLEQKAGIYQYVADSVTTGAGDKLPRRYYGANSQWKLKHGWGATEIRLEYWRGTQTGLANSSETPGEPKPLPGGNYAPNYVRPFDAGFLVLLQNIVNRKHQVGVKIDWYDPNIKVSGLDIGAAGSNLNEADIRYTTLGMGYLFYITDNFKFTLWYDRVWNESTSLQGFTADLPDNVLTARIQFRF